MARRGGKVAGRFCCDESGTRSTSRSGEEASWFRSAHSGNCGDGAAGWYGHNWWTDGRFLVSTDDAYISGDISVISPKVTGYVQKVNVIENQKVKAGDPLVTLDQGDYRYCG